MVKTEKLNKLLPLVIALIVFALGVAAAGVSHAYADIGKAVIEDIRSDEAGTFTVTSEEMQGVNSYLVKYSVSEDFSDAMIEDYGGSKLNAKVRGLTGGVKYYVRIQPYYDGEDGIEYGDWSDWRSVIVAGKTEDSSQYTTLVTTNIYKKKDASSKKITLWYNTELTVIDSTTNATGGTWYKVLYKGEQYYLWTEKGEKKLRGESAEMESYLPYCTTELQEEIIKRAFKIYKNWDTAYDFGSDYSKNVKKKNGKYLFHCSGFASYVYNKVLREYAPPFDLTSDLKAMSTKGSLLNKGFKSSEIKKRVICTGGSSGLTSAKKKKLQPGDLLFFKMDFDKRSINHVAIYIGNGQIIQSTRVIKGLYTNDGQNTDGGVCIAPLEGMYKENFKKAVRILPEKVKTANKRMKVKVKATNVSSNRNCTKSNGSTLHKGDKVKVLFTYVTKNGKKNAYIAYGKNFKKRGYLYLYKKKLK